MTDREKSKCSLGCNPQHPTVSNAIWSSGTVCLGCFIGKAWHLVWDTSCVRKMSGLYNHQLTSLSNSDTSFDLWTGDAVIKPIFGAASIGVVRVNDEKELQKTYRKVQEEMSSAMIVDGALVQGGPNMHGGGVSTSS